MTVPEIERMNPDTINERVEFVRKNVDLMTMVDTKEEMKSDGYTHIQVVFTFLKRVGK